MSSIARIRTGDGNSCSAINKVGLAGQAGPADFAGEPKGPAIPLSAAIPDIPFRLCRRVSL